MEIQELKNEVGEVTKLVKTRIKTLEQENEELKRQVELDHERIDILEAAGNRPGKAAGPSESDTERFMEGLGLYVKGMGLQNPETRQKGEKLLVEKAANIATATEGGNTVQTVIGRGILPELRKEPGIFSLVRFTEIDTAPSSFRRVVSSTNTNSGWVGEAGSRSATNTPDFNVASPTGGMLYSYPSITEELLNSSVFDIAEFIVSEVREDFRAAIAQAIISGSGTNRPTGLTQNAPVSTADDASPRRAFNVLQYLPTGAASSFQTEPYAQASPITNPLGCFWDALAATKSQYRREAVWVMNSNTLATLGKLRDLDGRHLFNPNPSAGQPMSLLGYPIVIDEYMADLGSNTHPVFFGDLSRGYEIVSNFDTRITVDEISTKGYVSYYVRSYLGGCVTAGEAVKAIKCATS